MESNNPITNNNSIDFDIFSELVNQDRRNLKSNSTYEEDFDLNNFYIYREGYLTNLIKVDPDKFFMLIDEKLIIDIDSTNNLGRTPLHVACYYHSSDIVKKLIMLGSNLNKRDVLGNTPLHYSSCINNLNITKLLIVNGADFKLKNNLGRSALDFATLNVNFDMINFLSKVEAYNLTKN